MELKVGDVYKIRYPYTCMITILSKITKIIGIYVDYVILNTDNIDFGIGDNIRSFKSDYIEYIEGYKNGIKKG